LLNTPGYYCKAYPKEKMNALKKRLEEFTPIGKNEKYSWVAACACIAQSQSKKRKSLGLSDRQK